MKKRTLKRKVKLFLYVLLITFLVITYMYFKQAQQKYLSITNFDECVASGHTVLTTYPEQCKIPGKVFINNSQEASIDSVKSKTSENMNTNPKNTSYDIDGQNITLQNGIATVSNNDEQRPSSTTIQYFGNELRVDIDGDSKEDSAFLVTSNNSGTGIFYYLVVSIKKDDQYIGTNGVLIGDRILPKTTEFKNGEIVVNYADRKIDQPMSVKPSINVSRYFKVINSTLTEISK